MLVTQLNICIILLQQRSKPRVPTEDVVIPTEGVVVPTDDMVVPTGGL